MNANNRKWATVVAALVLMSWTPASVFSQEFGLNWFSINGIPPA